MLERAYFGVCRIGGRLLRSAKYSRVEVAGDHARKMRSAYAPLLIALSVPLVKILDGGVRVLPLRAWHDRERRVYESLYGASIRVDAGALILPRLPGRTLASLLEDPGVDEPRRRRAIELSVAALVELHRKGFTHADAMAENVLVDLESGIARWLDFETVHDATRSEVWRRADDVRALLASCLVRTVPQHRSDTLRRIVDGYADREVTRVVATAFRSAWQRPLPLHLLQASLSFDVFRAIGVQLE